MCESLGGALPDRRAWHANCQQAPPQSPYFPHVFRPSEKWQQHASCQISHSSNPPLAEERRTKFHIIVAAVQPYCILDTHMTQYQLSGRLSSIKILILAQTPLFIEDCGKKVLLRLIKLLRTAHTHTPPCALGEGHGPRVQLGHSSPWRWACASPSLITLRSTDLLSHGVDVVSLRSHPVPTARPAPQRDGVISSTR